jgi:hypothetical protein
MESAEQFNGLTFDMRDAVEQTRNIIIGAVCANWTDGNAGKAGLANFGVEPGRLVNGNCIDGTNTETRCAFGILIARMQTVFRIQKNLRTVYRGKPFSSVEQTQTDTSLGNSI